MRAAGVGVGGAGRGGGQRGRARAPRRGRAAAPPPPGVWLGARVRSGGARRGDAEVKFGREGERSVSVREPEWPPLLSPARRPAPGKGGGTGLPPVAGREGGWATRPREP